MTSWFVISRSCVRIALSASYETYTGIMFERFIKNITSISIGLWSAYGQHNISSYLLIENKKWGKKQHKLITQISFAQMVGDYAGDHIPLLLLQFKKVSKNIIGIWPHTYKYCFSGRNYNVFTKTFFSI